MSCDPIVIVPVNAGAVIVAPEGPKRVVVVAPAAQGPAGAGAGGGAEISADADNRLKLGTDAKLYVSDTLNPDPLVYYMLAKG